MIFIVCKAWNNQNDLVHYTLFLFGKRGHWVIKGHKVVVLLRVRRRTCGTIYDPLEKTTHRLFVAFFFYSVPQTHPLFALSCGLATPPFAAMTHSHTDTTTENSSKSKKPFFVVTSRMSSTTGNSTALPNSDGSRSAQSTPSGQSSSSSAPDNSKVSNKVWTSRLIFLAGLAAVAAVLSWGAHRTLTESETKLAEQQFDAIAEHALGMALEVTLRKRLGAKSLATTVSHAFPDADAWPFVYLPYFPDVATSVIETAAAGTMGLSPLVKPEELRDFEEFLHQQAFGDQPYQDFQMHVTGFDESAGFMRYNETDGTTRGWNSPYQDIWPFSMHSFTQDILMFNLHSMKQFGEPIDEVYECAKARPPNETEALDLTQCAIMTDIAVGFNSDGSVKGPGAWIYQPVYPANDPQVVSGTLSCMCVFALVSYLRGSP